MRTIIAGSREGFDYADVLCAVHECGWSVTTVISGNARGVDSLGERFANHRQIPCEIYPANWNLHGKSAGYKRNELMATKAEALIALWDGESRGTKHMINIAKRQGLRIYIYHSK